MGGILGDHIAHQNCEKRRARSFSGDARYLCGSLKFGLDSEMNKDVLACLDLLKFHSDLFGCQGSFGIADGGMEFTTANIHIIRMGEHHPFCLQGLVREWCEIEMLD